MEPFSQRLVEKTYGRTAYGRKRLDRKATPKRLYFWQTCRYGMWGPQEVGERVD